MDQATFRGFWCINQGYSPYNTSAVSMGKNPVKHKRTKHSDVRHHFLRDNVEKGNVLTYCQTEEQIADIFTKVLSKDQFESNRLKLGMMTLQ